MKKKSFNCPIHCIECEYDKSNQDAIFIRCDYEYVLDPEDNKCKKCNSIDETMDGCESCIYNQLNKKYECKTCLEVYSDYGYYFRNYAYINNTFKCLPNTNPDIIGLYGVKLQNK